MQNKKKSIQSAACSSLICPFSIIWVGLNNKALISSCVGSFNNFLYLCGYTLIIGHNKDHLMHANCSLHKGIRMQTVLLHLTKKGGPAVEKLIILFYFSTCQMEGHFIPLTMDTWEKSFCWMIWQQTYNYMLRK